MQQGEWYSAESCGDAAIEELVRSAPDLPAEYLAYLRESDGGGGDIPVQPWGINFWKANKVPAKNLGYEVALNVPGFYAFGTSGGGEMFAFDMRSAKPWPVVIIPFIGMEAEATIVVAPDFASFRQMFGKTDELPADEIRLDDTGHPLDPNL